MQKSLFIAHRCRFVEWTSAAITATSFSHSCNFLALARADGSIEVWNIKYHWFMQLKIAGEGNDFVARSLLWVPCIDPALGAQTNSDQLCDERLFSAGLSGEIIEWDLEKLCIKERTIVGAGGIWQMSGLLARFTTNHQEANQEWQYRICVGCEDGRVRVFDVSLTPGASCSLRSTSLRQPCRVLCVAWHPGTKLICAGDADGNIRIFQAESCKQKYRMNTSTSKENPTRVWSVQFLRDGTIVSGNSLGDTEFWDSAVGVQQQSIRTHIHDITSIAVDRTGDVIAVAGINGKVIKVRKSGDRWAVQKGNRYHSHDVSTIAVACNGTMDWLVSGGLDNILVRQSLELMQSEGKNSTTFRFDPFPHYPLYSTSHSKHPLLLTHCKTLLQVWMMGVSQDIEMNQQNISSRLNAFTELPLLENARHILQLDLKTDLPIYCSAIAPNGKFIAASDTNKVFVFSLSSSKQIKRVSLGEVSGEGIIRISFAANQIILAYRTGLILIVDLLTKKIKHFKEHCNGKGSIHSLIVSLDAQWLASSDSARNVHIFNLDRLKECLTVLESQHHVTLPKFSDFSVTAMNFSPVEPVLTIACSNSHIYQFDVEAADLTSWSKEYSNSLPDSYLCEQSVITNITFDTSDPNICFLVSATFLCKIDFRLPVLSQHPSTGASFKRNRHGNEVSGSKRLPANFVMIKNYQPILFATFIKEGELAIIQRPRALLVKDLPAPVFRNRFYNR